MNYRRIKSWLWVTVALIAAIYSLLPWHIVIFADATPQDKIFASILGGIFSAVILVFYFRRPAASRPKNFANSHLGLPLLLAATFGAAGYFTATTVLPFGLAMIFGRNETLIVTVATNVYGASERGSRGCRHPLPLRASMGDWNWTLICFASAETKQRVRQSMPDAPVELTGWGNSTAIIYWSALPVDFAAK